MCQLGLSEGQSNSNPPGRTAAVLCRVGTCAEVGTYKDNLDIAEYTGPSRCVLYSSLDLNSTVYMYTFQFWSNMHYLYLDYYFDSKSKSQINQIAYSKFGVLQHRNRTEYALYTLSFYTELEPATLNSSEILFNFTTAAMLSLSLI